MGVKTKRSRMRSRRERRRTARQQRSTPRWYNMSTPITLHLPAVMLHASPSAFLQTIHCGRVAVYACQHSATTIPRAAVPGSTATITLSIAVKTTK